MSPKRSHIRMMHRVNILKKTTITNDMGQKIGTWTVDVMESPCYITPSGASASIRVQPTIEQADYLTVLLPHDAKVSYTARLANFETAMGEVIYQNQFQIIQIDKHMSFSGKVQYIQVTAKSVIE